MAYIVMAYIVMAYVCMALDMDRYMLGGVPVFYGLYSYGLYSYGPYSHGHYSYGLYSYALYSDGPLTWTGTRSLACLRFTAPSSQKKLPGEAPANLPMWTGATSM